MTDTISVVIRVRPLNEKEIAKTGDRKCLRLIPNSSSICFETDSTSKTFIFDKVLDSQDSQEYIFDSVIKPVAKNSLLGYNSTVLAYGQTGSGKTYTVIGPNTDSNIEDRRGILPRSIEFIHSKILGDSNFSVMISLIEIYQENIIDLLDTRSHSQHLHVREDMENGVYVENLTLCTVQTYEDSMRLVMQGLMKRSISRTEMNVKSSRAHSVLTIHIRRIEKEGSNIINIIKSRFNIVDLAGSESQKWTNAQGKLVKEASSINQSLSELGKVIHTLAEISEGKSRFVHYRNSKLTYLLKDSLGGNAKTIIIANVSPSLTFHRETRSTLLFAQRAKLVRNRAVINEETGGELIKLIRENKELKDDICRLRNELSSPRPCVCLKSDNSVRENELLSHLNHSRILNHETQCIFQVRIKYSEDIIKSQGSIIEKLTSIVNEYEDSIRRKDDTIKRYQESAGISLTDEYSALVDENRRFREQLNQYAQDMFIQSNREVLKRSYAQSQEEVDGSIVSIISKLQENKDFNARLHNTLNEILNERPLADYKNEISKLKRELEESKLEKESLIRSNTDEIELLRIENENLRYKYESDIRYRDTSLHQSSQIPEASYNIVPDPQTQVSEAMEPAVHMMTIISTLSSCLYCVKKSKASYCCLACNVPLHRDCFTRYHQLAINPDGVVHRLIDLDARTACFQCKKPKAQSTCSACRVALHKKCFVEHLKRLNLI